MLAAFTCLFNHERLDWFGFGIASANRTGAFIACLIALTWCLYAFRIKFLNAIAWISGLALFYFLVQTASRGALVSLIAAGIFFLLFAGFKFSTKSMLSIFLWVTCAIFIFAQSRLSSRMEEMLTLQSSSANCRMDIYLSGLKILTDAPGGVKSPVDTYMQWYQDPDDSERYLSLINSHLEFLCKNGIPLRFAYIAFWMFIFALLFPRSPLILPSACFSVWICFALSSTFSNVANYWVLWIIPIATLLLGAYCNRMRLKKASFYLFVIFSSLFTLGALHAASYLIPRIAPLTFYDNGDVLVGIGSPKAAIFKPDERIVGSHYGSEIAIFQGSKDDAILVSDKLKPHYVKKLLICSAPPEGVSMPHAKEIIFLNVPPPIDLSEYSEAKITAVIGSFADLRMRRAWENIANRGKIKIDLNILGGVAEYIPNWTRFISYEND